MLWSKLIWILVIEVLLVDENIMIEWELDVYKELEMIYEEDVILICEEVVSVGNY